MKRFETLSNAEYYGFLKQCAGKTYGLFRSWQAVSNEYIIDKIDTGQNDISDGFESGGSFQFARRENAPNCMRCFSTPLVTSPHGVVLLWPPLAARPPGGNFDRPRSPMRAAATRRKLRLRAAEKTLLEGLQSDRKLTSEEGFHNFPSLFVLFSDVFDIFEEQD
jgi:hypothetical protein